MGFALLLTLFAGLSAASTFRSHPERMPLAGRGAALIAASPQRRVYRSRVASAKVRFGLHELVQTHHVLPRTHRYHPLVVATGFDVESDVNLLLMPTWKGARRLRLRRNRLVHDGSHPLYNAFVGRQLDMLLASWIRGEGGGKDALLRAVETWREQMQRYSLVPSEERRALR